MVTKLWQLVNISHSFSYAVVSAAVILDVTTHKWKFWLCIHLFIPDIFSTLWSIKTQIELKLISCVCRVIHGIRPGILRQKYVTQKVSFLGYMQVYYGYFLKLFSYTGCLKSSKSNKVVFFLMKPYEYDYTWIPIKTSDCFNKVYNIKTLRFFQ